MSINYIYYIIVYKLQYLIWLTIYYITMLLYSYTKLLGQYKITFYGLSLLDLIFLDRFMSYIKTFLIF